MKKTHKVVMLPTEKAENCIAMYHNGKISWTNQLLTKDYRDSANVKVFHLYIISYDEIKEGDWQYTRLHGVTQAKNLLWSEQEGANKIVATTDTQITSDYSTPGELFVPSISESFIQAYIKDYNEGKPITEVDLEMVDENSIIIWGPLGETELKELTIKTRPDNTVIVHQSKMYSRDEVIAFAMKYAKRCQAPIQAGDDWIQDNL